VAMTMTVANAMSLWIVKIATLIGFPEWLTQTPEARVKRNSNPQIMILVAEIFISDSFICLA
jgi:hypothetical protein